MRQCKGATGADTGRAFEHYNKVVESKRLQYRVSGMIEWQDVPICFEDEDRVIESDLSQFDNVSVLGACHF